MCITKARCHICYVVVLTRCDVGAGCPLCMREVNMLKRRDEGKGRIWFVDVDSPEYRPEENADISYEQVYTKDKCLEGTDLSLIN